MLKSHTDVASLSLIWPQRVCLNLHLLNKFCNHWSMAGNESTITAGAPLLRHWRKIIILYVDLTSQEQRNITPEEVSEKTNFLFFRLHLQFFSVSSRPPEPYFVVLQSPSFCFSPGLWELICKCSFIACVQLGGGGGGVSLNTLSSTNFSLHSGTTKGHLHENTYPRP